jgi:hypothetical protein
MVATGINANATGMLNQHSVDSTKAAMDLFHISLSA